MDSRASRHREAAKDYDAAAERHMEAAEQWYREGDSERAQLEHRGAVLAWASAHLERERADLEERRTTSE
jgi:hypothetical protein